jgi:hypothetical protein
VVEIHSPHDQFVLGRVAQASNADIDRAVAAAREAFRAGHVHRPDHSHRPATARDLPSRVIIRCLLSFGVRECVWSRDVGSGSMGWPHHPGDDRLGKVAEAGQDR